MPEFSTRRQKQHQGLTAANGNEIIRRKKRKTDGYCEVSVLYTYTKSTYVYFLVLVPITWTMGESVLSFILVYGTGELGATYKSVVPNKTIRVDKKKKQNFSCLTEEIRTDSRPGRGVTRFLRRRLSDLSHFMSR